MTDIILKNIDDPEICYSIATTFLMEHATPSTRHNIDKDSIIKLIRNVVEMPPTAFDTFCDLIRQLRKREDEEPASLQGLSDYA